MYHTCGQIDDVIYSPRLSRSLIVSSLNFIPHLESNITEGDVYPHCTLNTPKRKCILRGLIPTCKPKKNCGVRKNIITCTSATFFSVVTFSENTFVKMLQLCLS